MICTESPSDSSTKVENFGRISFGKIGEESVVELFFRIKGRFSLVSLAKSEVESPAPESLPESTVEWKLFSIVQPKLTPGCRSGSNWTCQATSISSSFREFDLHPGDKTSPLPLPGPPVRSVR